MSALSYNQIYTTRLLWTGAPSCWKMSGFLDDTFSIHGTSTSMDITPSTWTYTGNFILATIGDRELAVGRLIYAPALKILSSKKKPESSGSNEGTQKQVAAFNTVSPVVVGEHLSHFNYVRLVAEILLIDSTHRLLAHTNNRQKWAPEPDKWCWASWQRLIDPSA